MGRPTLNTVRGALYYPFPVFQSDGWLKEQALFWDRLYRVVPVGFQRMAARGLTTTPTRTQSVLADAGFIEDLAVDQDDLAPVAQQLIDLLSTPVTLRDLCVE